MILFDKTKTEFDLDFNTAGVWQKFYCQCDYCGIIFLQAKRTIIRGMKIVKKQSCSKKDCMKFKREESQLLVYGVKNSGGTKVNRDKVKKTCLEKFGTENPSQNSDIKEKIKNTNLKKYGSKSYLATTECRVKLHEKSLEKYGTNLPAQSDEIKTQIKKTSMEKYGESHYSKTDEFKERLKNTCVEKYNVSNPALIPDSIEKRQHTNLEKYGVIHPLQNNIVYEKYIKTMQEKYNCDNYAKTSEFKIKFKNTMQIKYGVDHAMQSEYLRNKLNETCIKKYNVNWVLQCPAIRDQIKLTCIEKYGADNIFKVIKFNSYGKTQKEIKDWLTSLNENFEENKYNIIPQQELDLFNKDKKIAIEYCGLYWHNESSRSPRDRTYHKNKYDACRKLGIRLFTIFEDEWLYKKEICKNILKHALQINNHKIQARKCTVREIEKTELIKFCNLYHIQGGNNLSLVSFGLFFKDELIGAISLGRHPRTQQHYKIILDRLCFKSNISVVGGASKLFLRCVEWAKMYNYKEIISWSDNRWSEGKIYQILQFQLDKVLNADYSYVDLKNCKKRLSKQSQKKINTGCPKNKTEKEWATENGLARIWDCGKKRWLFKINPF